jgi:hypothetical protein
MTTISRVSFASRNPFRTPSWRHEYVLNKLERSASTTVKTGNRDDDIVRRYWAFTKRLHASPKNYTQAAIEERLFAQDPDLFLAHKLWLQRDDPDASLTHIVEARILAEQSDDDIARLTTMTPQAVALYADLFFDVRNRLRASDWIYNIVLLPDIYRARSRAAMASSEAADTLVDPYHYIGLKLFAFFGGPFAFDTFLYGFVPGRRPMTYGEVSSWMDSAYATQIRRRVISAMTSLKVTKYNAIQLFEAYDRLLTSERQANVSNEQKDTTGSDIITSLVQSLSWTVGQQDINAGILAGRDTGGGEMRAAELMQLTHMPDSGQTVVVPSQTLSDLAQQEIRDVVQK